LPRLTPALEVPGLNVRFSTLRGLQAKFRPDGQPLTSLILADARQTLHVSLNAAVADGILGTNPATPGKLLVRRSAAERRRFIPERNSSPPSRPVRGTLVARWATPNCAG